MQRVRGVYGALIRAPVIGPFARLPLRLVRWWLQDPDLDPAIRADRLAVQLEALQARLEHLTLAHEALCRDQERTRLILFMMSGQLQPPSPPPPHARPEPARTPERRRVTRVMRRRLSPSEGSRAWRDRFPSSSTRLTAPTFWRPP